MAKKQSALTKITKAFISEKILLQHYVAGYQIVYIYIYIYIYYIYIIYYIYYIIYLLYYIFIYIIYFPKHKLAIDVDDKGHKDRNKYKETEKQNAIEKEFNCKFIGINPDGEDFDVYVEISKISFYHINKSSKKLLVDKISKRLLKLEFKSDHSIKSKVLKQACCQKILLSL